MQFGFDKCATAVFIKGKMTEISNVNINQELEQAENYLYQEVLEGNGIKYSLTKERIRKECIRRVRETLKAEVNARNDEYFSRTRRDLRFQND